MASALGVLSYPVVADELLRLTAFLHANEQGGRLGEALTLTLSQHDSLF